MIEVDLALLADAANLSMEGKLNILGEFNLLLSDHPPWTMVGRSLVIRLVGNAGDQGAHTLGLRILDQDRKLLWSSRDGRIDFKPAKIPGTLARMAATLELPPVILHSEGTHEFEILVDGRIARTVELHCVLRKDMPDHAAG